MRPLFIVLEGLDGAGKTTLGRRLADHLNALRPDPPALFTYEPHDPSAAGEYIRAVLAKQFTVAPRTLALAYALNRADHTERVIAPHLAAGGIVICDRYLLSSLAYNSGPDLPMDKVLELNAAARRPDLTLFLDADAAICYQRLGERGGDRELFESRL
ncbi:MAG: dTMP kinase, partial [Anaerolinea sp.]|nr:dTMP kinase [Anaerolinea sp.]